VAYLIWSFGTVDSESLLEFGSRTISIGPDQEQPTTTARYPDRPVPD
jgi:hypothetical protein